MVELDVVQGRPVPGPVLLHDSLAEGVEPAPSIEPSRDRPEDVILGGKMSDNFGVQ